jgi:hypothetical protein
MTTLTAELAQLENILRARILAVLTVVQPPKYQLICKQPSG